MHSASGANGELPANFATGETHRGNDESVNRRVALGATFSQGQQLCFGADDTYRPKDNVSRSSGRSTLSKSYLPYEGQSVMRGGVFGALLANQNGFACAIACDWT
jgi:hypothetical protein